MKTLIWQSWTGPIPSWVHVGVNRFKKYADKFGADHIFDTVERYPVPHFCHLHLIYDKSFEKYDRILYVDVDVVPENFDENIFDEEIVDVGAVPEHTPKGATKVSTFLNPNKQREFERGAKIFKIPVIKPATVDSPYLMFNSGVILWSREGIQKARASFFPWKKWYNTTRGLIALDQAYISGLITKHLDYRELDIKWNSLPRMRFPEGQFPGGNFLHYTGGKKTHIEKTYNE